MSCSPGIPQTRTPRFVVQRGYPRRGGISDAYPSCLLTLPKVVQHRLYLMLRATRSPIPSLRAVMGKGEAEQSHAACPPEPPRTPRCTQHRRAPSPGSGEALRISRMPLFPR